MLWGQQCLLWAIELNQKIKGNETFAPIISQYKGMTPVYCLSTVSTGGVQAQQKLLSTSLGSVVHQLSKTT
jgi:hypothetical protein